jgi:phosphate/sulfate permease
MYLAANPLDSDGTFYAYVGALAVSAVLLLIIAGAGFGSSTSSRVVTGLVGFGFLGYAFYLFFIFEGGTYRMFPYVFVLPLLFIYQLFRSRKEKQEQAQAQAQAEAQAQAPTDTAA